MTKCILLCGEGKSELGSRAGHPAYQSDEQPGVLEELLKRVRATGWEVAGAREWKSVRQLQAGKGARDEKRVRALALDAKEARCDVLVFTRDCDNDDDRAGAIRRGIAKAEQQFQISIVGDVAMRVLEAWILALKGVARSEMLSPERAKTELHAAGVETAAEMAEVAANANLGAIPDDAISLNRWLGSAHEVLTRDE